MATTPKKKRLRPSYRKGIENIALNDEPSFMDEDDLIGQTSVHAISAAFDKELEEVARDVIRFRKRAIKEGWL